MRGVAEHARALEAHASATASTVEEVAASVEEVAELVAVLASPAGHLMTGQLIQIDGAAHLGTGLHMLEPNPA